MNESTVQPECQAHLARAFIVAPWLRYEILGAQSSERSSAWLEHLVWDQDVAGSNPVAPTILDHSLPGFPMDLR